MPYDEQGNFYGSDDLNALEAKYTKPDYASQIPGQVSSSKSDKPQSLRDQAVSALMQYNPLMLRKSLQEASGAVAGGMALPVVAPISAGIQSLNALPGNLYRKYLGEEQVKTPTTEELMQKYGQAIAPKTPLGQEMAEGVSKAFQASKLEGLMGMHPTVARGVSPSDVTVGAGQIKQLAKELRETPQDFKAAQSGLKRQNLYGEDTIGVKAQAAADSLGDTLERRRAEGKPLLGGTLGMASDIIAPETKLYAVRPGKSRIVQPVIPETAGQFQPEHSKLNELISDIYGDTAAKEMPPSMVMTEYSSKFIRDNPTLLDALSKFEKEKAMEMFPDAPNVASAQRAYDLKFAERNARNQQQLAHIEEFFETPEGAQFREQGVPTPTEFMERMAEGERVIKGPFINFISKNLGAEGDPSVKLARQGITFETPERIRELSNYVNPSELARNRLEGGYPAMGTYAEEHYTAQRKLDKLNSEIEELEAIRQPIFERAHAEDFNPSIIPEYAETTNPLRVKLREREKLQEEVENIKLARSYEDLSDYAVTPKTKEQMLSDIPYEQRQFFPSVTRAGDTEKLYTVNRGLLNDIGFKKLGETLLSDILTGQAGDTSKLTVENYIRQKHLTRVEAEKAAKVQQQQYRQALETVLTQRLRDAPDVKTYGNAAVITLTKDTPKDVALRDVSTDTAVLDHCVGQGGTAPNGRKNILSGQQQYYEPIIDPVTGERNKNVRDSASSSYVDGLAHGAELASIRDVKTGLPAATLQLNPTYDGDGKFDIGYASGAKNGAVAPEYTNAIRDYLNGRADSIRSSGSNLADNTGVFDILDARELQRAARAAKLNQNQLDLIKNSADIPRFVTAEDLKKASEGVAPVQSTEVAVRNEAPVVQLTEQDYQGIVDDYNDALMNAARDALENSNLENPERVERGINNIASSFFDTHMNDQGGFLTEPNARLLRVERALEDRIASLHNQGSDYHAEVADALDNFLIDVRGIRGNVERRLRMAEERAATERQQAPAQVPVTQGDPMPNMSADDLLASHGDRMTPEQRRWLEDFNHLWEEHVDDTPAGAGMSDMLSRQYQEWRQQNRLQPDPHANLFDDIGDFEPDPGAVANAPDVFTLAARYDIPPVTVQEIQARFRDPEITVADLSMLRDSARAGAPRTVFENLPQEARDGAANMITEEIQRRRQEAPPAVQNAQQLMPRNPVPRNVQTMAAQDLLGSLELPQQRRAREIAEQFFRDNTFNREMPISTATNMLRNHETQIAEGAGPLVREQAARNLEQMYAAAQHDADQVAEALREIFYDDHVDDPQAAITQIGDDIAMLRQHGEGGWEDLVGPMAEDIPWSPTMQELVIENLETIRGQFGELRDRRGFAKGGMVKKTRTTPLVASRKSPELAEMAYQYGGMVK